MYRHQSIFTYNASRPYPFRWFTPVVTLTGLLLLVLFSYLNYASNGFDLTVVTSSNPNATVADRSELSGLPPILTAKYNTKCQPANIVVNSEFFTNQTGLMYRLTAIWQDDELRTVSPVLTYSNNVLQNCSITSIEVEYSAGDRTANQIGFNAYGAVVHTFATCSLLTDTGMMRLNITNDYDYIPPSVSFTVLTPDIHDWTVRANFVDRNSTTRASLWWGESIMSTYWAWATKDMELLRPRGNVRAMIRKGTVIFKPTDNGLDILDSHFFLTQYRFVVGYERAEIIWSDLDEEHPLGYYAADLEDQGRYPEIWALTEKLAKSAWSTILVDLGQSAPSNILLDSAKLESFTADFNEKRLANAHPGPEFYPFNTTNITTGPLGATPSVISARYLCHVPRRKATSTLVWQIMVANLVFVGAAWTLFTLVIDHFFLKKIPDANYCAG